MSHYDHDVNTESGNILIFVLIAVILFGALTYAFTQTTSGTGINTLERSQNRTRASEVIDYASDIKQAVSQIKLLNDCEPSEISFDYGSGDDVSTPAHDYNNTNSSPGCKVFDGEGGGVSYKKPRSQWLESSATTQDWLFNEVNISGVGSDKHDLLMHLREVRGPLCKQLNQELGVGAPQSPAGDVTQNLYNDAFTGPNATASGIDQKTACVKQSGKFYFYKVLISR